LILRTHYSGDINAKMDGKEVTLAGFAHEMRDLGGIAFLVLRDRKGLAQITLVKKLLGKEAFKSARAISRESVVMVRGTVKAEAKAPRGYEILPSEITVLNPASGAFAPRPHLRRWSASLIRGLMPGHGR